MRNTDFKFNANCPCTMPVSLFMTRTVKSIMKTFIVRNQYIVDAMTTGLLSFVN